MGVCWLRSRSAGNVSGRQSAPRSPPPASGAPRAGRRFRIHTSGFARGVRRGRPGWLRASWTWVPTRRGRDHRLYRGGRRRDGRDTLSRRAPPGGCAGGRCPPCSSARAARRGPPAPGSPRPASRSRNRGHRHPGVEPDAQPSGEPREPVHPVEGARPDPAYPASGPLRPVGCSRAGRA